MTGVRPGYLGWTWTLSSSGLLRGGVLSCTLRAAGGVPGFSLLQPHLLELNFSLGSPSLFLYSLAQLAPCFLP